MLTPVMLQSHARSGTTAFMLILSCAEEVYFSRQYPFEERDLTYMIRLANLATRPIEKPARNEFLDPGLNALRGYPYVGAGDFFDDSDAARKNLFLTLWGGYSANAEAKGRFRYYAEKVVPDVREKVNLYIPSKNVALVRDPRAVFSSILQFDEKRGYYAFGRQASETVLSFAERFSAQQSAVLKQFISAIPGENQLKLRYEDLMRDFFPTIDRIEEFLDTSIDMEKLKRDFGAYVGRHATSKNAAASIDSWRDKLDEDVKSIFAERLADDLAALEYD